MLTLPASKIKRKHYWIWILLIISLIIVYLSYMAWASPMGLHSPPFHQQRIYQAVNTILNAEIFPKIGITAWNDLQDVLQAESSRGNVESTLYILNVAQYIHYTIAKILLPDVSIIKIAKIMDLLTLIMTAILLGLVSNYLFISARFNLLLSALVSLIFATSVWTYRAFLAPAKEFYMLPMLLICILCFIHKYIASGTLTLTLCSIIDYHWGTFIFVSYLPAFAGIVFPAIAFPSYLLPPSITHFKKISRLAIPSVLLVGLIVASLQNLLLKFAFPKLLQSNSNVLFRIGIDSVDNIHYGGFLGPFQFMLGQRITSCLISGPLEDMKAKIFAFNCSFNLLSMLVLSLLSIVGVYLAYKHIAHAKWILWPCTLAIICFSLTFSQSWSAHLSGYSYMFAPLFSIGLIYLIYWILSKLFDDDVQAALLVVVCPFVAFAVIVNSIRLSLLTGANA